jgi:peroxiredoxin
VRTTNAVLASAGGLGAAMVLACGLSGCGGDGAGETPAGASDDTSAAPTNTADTPYTTEDTMNDAETTGALTGQLEATKAGFRSRAPQTTQDLYARGTREVADSGILDAAKNVGDTAPGFELSDAAGRAVTLDGLLSQGPVVMVWYRGGWCPYCNLTLRAYQERLDEITALGATLVAISPELPDSSLSTKDKNELAFTVLSDRGNAVARDYGVVFTLNDDVKASYANFFSLVEFNGDDSGDLPLSATYVIDANGTIRWAFLDADYTKRAEPGDVIAALRAIDG